MKELEGTKRSRRSGVLRQDSRIVNARPRRSQRNEGARQSQWTDGPRRRGESKEQWWSQRAGAESGAQRLEAESRDAGEYAGGWQSHGARTA